jgi:hypothetical protein
MEFTDAPEILSLIQTIRGQRIILDEHLAAIYGVTTKRLTDQYRRNLERFSEDFAFRLTAKEWAARKLQTPFVRSDANLKSQFATSSFAHGGRRIRMNVAGQSNRASSEKEVGYA